VCMCVCPCPCPCVGDVLELMCECRRGFRWYTRCVCMRARTRTRTRARKLVVVGEDVWWGVARNMPGMGVRVHVNAF